MAEVPSTHQLTLGSTAPAFSLLDPKQGKNTVLVDLPLRSATVIAFVCNHCPFVVHLADAMAKIATDYSDSANFIAINSNDTDNYPADSPEKMITFAAQYGWDFPYLFDSDQKIAHAYAAACTPDFFLFDQNMQLSYAGQFDYSRPGNGKPIDGADLRAALDATLRGELVPEPHHSSTGCNIKWRPGNEPAYF